jgi:hypothetical protein
MQPTNSTSPQVGSSVPPQYRPNLHGGSRRATAQMHELPVSVQFAVQVSTLARFC